MNIIPHSYYKKGKYKPSVSELDSNKTLMAQQFTDSPDPDAEIVQVKSVTEAFEQFKPSIDVDLESEQDGDSHSVNIEFKKMSDFTEEAIIENTEELKLQKNRIEELEKIAEKIDKNRTLQKVIVEDRNALIDTLKNLLQELKDN